MKTFDDYSTLPATAAARAGYVPLTTPYGVPVYWQLDNVIKDMERAPRADYLLVNAGFQSIEVWRLASEIKKGGADE